MINPYLDPNKKVIVYRHIRLDINMPFYIGIAKKSYRPYDKAARNRQWKSIVNSLDGKYRVDILFTDLTIEEAYAKEIELIELYGRTDLGTGCLCNMTRGGEMMHELSPEVIRRRAEKQRGRTLSQEAKDKISVANKGRKMPDHVKAVLCTMHKGKPRCPIANQKSIIKNTGKKRTEEFKKRIAEIARNISDETREKMSVSAKNKTLTEEHKAKLREASRKQAAIMSEAKIQILLNVETGVYYTWQDLADIFGVTASAIQKRMRSKKKSGVKNLIVTNE